MKMATAATLAAALTQAAGAFAAPPANPAPREFRGVWVATVNNLDFPRSASAQDFKKNFGAVCSRLARKGCNALIFQLRANCDAFYPSSHAPWAASLAGKEGRGFAGFDPLAYMISECRRQGMEFHAWFNPYRVVSATKLDKAAFLSQLAPGNFARKNPDLVMAVPLGGGRIGLMLDPGEPAVIRHIVAVISEAASRYRPDAVHFDDYFYPYDSDAIPDGASFRRNNPRGLSLADWRRNNVNSMILGVRRALDTINAGRERKIRFGVSPFGIWCNRSPACPAGSLTKGKESFTTLYADSRLWVQKRWIDYVAPQIYWHRAHKKASFTVLLDWWCQAVRGTGVKLYIGHALYQCGKPGWGPDELASQLALVRSRPESSGSVLFSCRHILTPPDDAVRRAVYGVWNKGK